MKLREAHGLTEEVDRLYSLASHEYLESALCYPVDEEHHICEPSPHSIHDLTISYTYFKGIYTAHFTRNSMLQRLSGS